MICSQVAHSQCKLVQNLAIYFYPGGKFKNNQYRRNQRWHDFVCVYVTDTSGAVRFHDISLQNKKMNSINSRKVPDVITCPHCCQQKFYLTLILKCGLVSMLYK